MIVSIVPVICVAQPPIPVPWPWWASILWSVRHGTIEGPFGPIECRSLNALPPCGSNLLSWN